MYHYDVDDQLNADQPPWSGPAVNSCHIVTVLTLHLLPSGESTKTNGASEPPSLIYFLF